MSKKGLLIGLVVLAVAVAAYFAWSKLKGEGLPVPAKPERTALNAPAARPMS